MTNGNTPPKTEMSNKKQKRAFFLPNFIHLLQLWKVVDIRKNNNEQRKAIKSSKKIRIATKSKYRYRSWKIINWRHKKSKWKLSISRSDCKHMSEKCFSLSCTDMTWSPHRCNDYKYWSFAKNICNRHAESFFIWARYITDWYSHNSNP